MINIQIIENGPAIIKSSSEEIEITGTDIRPNQGFTDKVALCRCGKSSNGIYCDGSHSKKYDESGYEIKD